MTNPIIEAPQPTASFDERIEILAKELELAVKWQRPCVLLVVYSSEYVRADVEAALENFLIDLGQKTVRLQIKNQRRRYHRPLPEGVQGSDPRRISDRWVAPGRR